MTCAVDDILDESGKAVQGVMEQLLQELATDFNLELDADKMLDSSQAATLRGALQTFSVWAVQQGRKS